VHKRLKYNRYGNFTHNCAPMCYLYHHFVAMMIHARKCTYHHFIIIRFSLGKSSSLVENVIIKISIFKKWWKMYTFLEKKEMRALSSKLIHQIDVSSICIHHFHHEFQVFHQVYWALWGYWNKQLHGRVLCLAKLKRNLLEI
jgi:hypothetical protein